MDGLHRDWILALAAFVKHSRKTNNNEEVTKNMKIRWDIDPRCVSSLFVWLHESIQCWNMDGKGIADVTKLAKELVWCSLVWGTNRRPRRDYIWIGGGEPIHEPTNERKP